MTSPIVIWLGPPTQTYRQYCLRSSKDRSSHHTSVILTICDIGLLESLDSIGDVVRDIATIVNTSMEVVPNYNRRVEQGAIHGGAEKDSI